MLGTIMKEAFSKITDVSDIVKIAEVLDASVLEVITPFDAQPLERLSIHTVDDPNLPTTPTGAVKPTGAVTPTGAIQSDSAVSVEPIGSTSEFTQLSRSDPSLKLDEEPKAPKAPKEGPELRIKKNTLLASKQGEGEEIFYSPAAGPSSSGQTSIKRLSSLLKITSPQPDDLSDSDIFGRGSDFDEVMPGTKGIVIKRNNSSNL